MSNARARLKASTLSTVTGLFALSVLATAAPASAESVAYQDSAAKGSIGLCDSSGKPVTGGNIHDRPFVWRAVASDQPAEPYGAKGTKATLLAYQPRPNTPADAWNGDTLTSTSTYTNPRYPMAQATSVDFTLQDFLNEYKPMVDGMIQLRMYVGAPGVGTLTESYPTTDIKVTGDTWHVVRGGSVPCSNGSAESSEVLPAAKGSGTAVATGSPTSTTPAGQQASASQPAGSAGSTSEASTGASPAAKHASARSGSSFPVAVVVAAVVLAAICSGVGFMVWRRSRSGASV
jgi:hypothetical protein